MSNNHPEYSSALKLAFVIYVTEIDRRKQQPVPADYTVGSLLEGTNPDGLGSLIAQLYRVDEPLMAEVSKQLTPACLSPSQTKVVEEFLTEASQTITRRAFRGMRDSMYKWVAQMGMGNFLLSYLKGLYNPSGDPSAISDEEIRRQPGNLLTAFDKLGTRYTKLFIEASYEAGIDRAARDLRQSVKAADALGERLKAQGKREQSSP